MAINFPTGPTAGQLYSAGGKTWVYQGGVWQPTYTPTALPKNYIVNPCMQISEQNGDAASVLGVTSYYPADQWWMVASLTAPTTVQTYRVTKSNLTVTGSKHRLLLTAGDNSSLTAANYVAFLQRIEGQRMADLRWGTAAAKSVVLRFGVSHDTVPITMTVTLRTPGVTWATYTASYTIPNTADQVVTLAIPGPTTGTWPVTNAAGMEVWFVFAIGSNHAVNTSGVWNTGSALGIVGQNNNLFVSGAAFELFDVGLYADPYKTGLAPPFEVPEFGAELRRCQRYWNKVVTMRGVTTGATNVRVSDLLPVQMRAAPTMTLSGTPGYYDGAVGTTISAISTSYSTSAVAEANLTGSGWTLGRSAVMSPFSTTDTNHFIMSARM